MINFEQIEKKLDVYINEFNNEKIFPFVIINNFCDNNKLMDLYYNIPAINKKNKSKDLMFSAKKYERSNLTNIDPLFLELHDDLLSNRFKKIIRKISGKKVFIDDKFHGGGIHQGASGSFLGMHTDFNYHPNNPNWLRYFNLLLFVNPGWEKKWGGQLQLQNKLTKAKHEIEPIFNRMVIMVTNDITLHGYNKINFPDGLSRNSIASYAYYRVSKQREDVRTTNWNYNWSSPIRKFASLVLPPIIIFKNKYFGNRTSKNYND